MARAERLAEALVRLEVLAPDEPMRFLHPVVREALEESMGRHERERAHRQRRATIAQDGAPVGQIAAHLVGLRPGGDQWVLARLRAAAAAAMSSGTPTSAASLLRRALVEPPAQDERVAVLREAARAEASSGHDAACALLERALELVSGPRERAEIALEVAETYAALFRWVDAVDLLDRALAELGDADAALAARLEGELVVSGLHDARRATRVTPVLERLASRERRASGRVVDGRAGHAHLPQRASRERHGAATRGSAAALQRCGRELGYPCGAYFGCSSPRSDSALSRRRSSRCSSRFGGRVPLADWWRSTARSACSNCALACFPMRMRRPAWRSKSSKKAISRQASGLRLRC